MLKGKDIICISSIDWDFVWQGHQEIMSAFARSGNRVLFIENTGIRAPNFSDFTRLKKRIINWFKSTRGFRKEMDDLYVYSPVILPFPYSRIAHWINRRMLIRPLKNWMKIMEFQRPIVWTFLPTRTALDIADNVDKSLLVYYCIADFYKLADNPAKVRRTEDELIRRSDLIFAQGQALYDKCSRLNRKTHIFPFGVNIKVFDEIRFGRPRVPQDIKNIRKPIIGYIGGIHRHIDFGLLEFIARAHPEWSLVLVGPIQADVSRIKDLKNIFLLGKKEFAELPSYINEFAVGIIPYGKTDYTATVYPTKLNEYHALAKPVVSTDLPEVVNFNAGNNQLVRVAQTFEEFSACISQALAEAGGQFAALRIASAEKNNWSARIGQMSGLIEESIRCRDGTPVDWREKLTGLYRLARHKILKLVFVSAAAYLAVFYTPLVWFIAGPLKIAQQPQKADCIVVFAGGVGESGQAGQGYEERVEEAVELYKQGYAGHILFSSGYAYVFKEPQVMKALAISLGVPEEAIILEDRAVNTYENVKYSFDILSAKGWHEILLVSSPYHMRRVSLVFNKIGKDVKVRYAPVKNSRFYLHPARSVDGKRIWKRANFAQIAGIIHEYAGIAYYWWKGMV